MILIVVSKGLDRQEHRIVRFDLVVAVYVLPLVWLALMAVDKLITQFRSYEDVDADFELFLYVGTTTRVADNDDQKFSFLYLSSFLEFKAYQSLC